MKENGNPGYLFISPQVVQFDQCKDITQAYRIAYIETHEGYKQAMNLYMSMGASTQITLPGTVMVGP